MSSEDNSTFSNVTNYRPSSGVVPSLAIDNEEGIDVQSSIQGSLVRQSPLHSLQSSRQSLNLKVQSLKDSQLISNEKDGVDSKVNDNTKSRKSKVDKIKIQKLIRKDRILRKVQYAMYTLLSIIAAFIVLIIWYTSWLEENTITNEIANKQTESNANSNDSNCQFWHIVGDGFCDDEANIVECGYDLKDCCEMGNDRTLCEDCFCFIPEADKASIEEKYLEKCSLFIPQYLGRGNCDLNMNNVENYFDLGDCCLEDVSCRIKFFNETDYVTKYCPENPCIRSNIFCVQEELGNGLCEDHNNSPYCDYDLGDCCIYGQNYGPPTSTRHPSKIDCCECACKQTPLHPANMPLHPANMNLG